MADAHVWDLRPGDTALRWFARCQPDGVLGGVVKSRQGTLRLLRNLNGRANLYWGINRSDKLTGIRVSAKDITHWCNVLLDIDPVEPDAQPLEAAKVFLTRAEGVLNQSLFPTIIHSGRGVQLILSLEPLHLDDALRRQVRAGVGAFLRAVMVGPSSSPPAPVYGCVVDTSCSDLARVARMPETVNLKTKVESRIENRGVLAEGLAQGILALAGRVVEEIETPSIVADSWQQVWHLLTARAQRFLMEGSTSPGRHTSAYACARSLRERGLQPEKAVRVVANGAALCDPPLPTHEVQRIVRCAYT